MTNPSPSSREFSDARRRSSVRGALVMLVLLMLGFLLWQLHQEFRQLQASARQRSLESSAQLADHLAQGLQLRANAGATLLRQAARERPSGELDPLLLDNLHGLFPALQSLAWLDRDGHPLADSDAEANDVLTLEALAQRIGNRPYHYAYTPGADGRIYLFLHQPGGVDSGFWVLRLDPRWLRQWLLSQRSEGDWLLEDTTTQRAIVRSLRPAATGPSPVTAEERSQSILLVPLQGSDWQFRALFDVQYVRNRLLPDLSGKLALFVACSFFTLLALFGLQREQRTLQALNDASRRSLRQAASALRAVEEPVLITDGEGHLGYLNPQAEALLGLSDAEAAGQPLRALLPGLDPLLLHGPNFIAEAGAELVEVTRAGDRRLFAVNRSDLHEGARHAGFVWVLRDVTDEQHSMQVLRQARRRYQDIFEGTGTALCVLDLSDLHGYLSEHRLCDSQALADWLQADPRHHEDLQSRLRITEANQVATQLLGVHDAREAWSHLIGDGPLRPGGLRMRLIESLFSGDVQTELETRLVTPRGEERHLWLVMRLPEHAEDYRAVTLSISDITSRKQIELSLIERERFWSEVVRAVPDTLYVHDMGDRSVLFSNNRLGQQLGYGKAELMRMGERFWERIVHPDDRELFERVRNLQQVVGSGLLLQSQIRWRHQNGSWHWFDIREQALTRDARGRVKHLIGVAKDITEQIERSESLLDSERRYRLLAESISDVIFTTDAELQLNYVSPSIKQMLGHSSEWALRNGLQSVLANPDQVAGLTALLERIEDAMGDPQRMAELRRDARMQLFIVDCLRTDGRKLPVELRAMLLWDEHGRFEGLIGVARDISQQRHAEKELRMAATVFEHSTAAILVTDPAGYIVQVNKTFSRISGYQSAEVLDERPSMLLAEQFQSSQTRYILGQLDARGSWEGEVWLSRRNGENYPAWVGITAVRDDEGDLVSYVCFFNDISERKASEQRIHRLAYYDALTHLPNRTLFQDRLHTALQSAERHGEAVVLMFLDLDRFKPINDSLGHAAGDRMLQEVAVRLAACVQQDDTVARMGGDEFTLLLSASPSREQAMMRAIHVGEQILASLAQPFVLEGREFFVTASVGIALSPLDGNEPSQLMKNADTAMYHAKERGKNNFQFYQAEMNASALERLELESDLRHALEQGQFVLHYQPQFSGDGKRLTGAEALLRWQHPVRGLVPPSDFIPVLEELGLVVQVGDWALSEACRQLKAWHTAKVRVPKVSVNLSARQFADGQLGARISGILKRSGLPAACLEIELTESILMRDVGEAMQILAGLKRLGLCIAVDDFGTGYSSLNYLKQFPIDVLKIDRTFVDGLPEGEQDGQIARAIIAMAHSLNLSVIAEGVESHAQLDFLRNHGCDEVQGFLFGKPMPASQFEAQFSGGALFILD